MLYRNAGNRSWYIKTWTWRKIYEISICYSYLSLFFTKKSLFAHCSFDSNRNKYDYYIGYDCMKKFCKQFKEHAAKNN